MVSNIDFESMQNFIDSMYDGNIENIAKGLRHKGALLRVNAILAMAENRITDSVLIELVKKLKNDNTIIDGISVGDYAAGLLDVYNIEKYQGNSTLIKNLIRDKFYYTPKLEYSKTE